MPENHRNDALGSRGDFLAARDLLLALREDYDEAVARFRWPQVDRFNWAIDWFDGVLASGALADATALEIIGDNAASLSFRDLSRRSDALANGLKRIGVRPGDRILLMLGNRSELWETMLAAMKLGAVTIPASTLLTAQDIAERISEGQVSIWIAEPELAQQSAAIGADLIRICVGDGQTGWHSYDALLSDNEPFTPERPAMADDPILLYFTSGTTSRPKLVMHTHRSYGIGALSTMYWLGLQPGDRHLNVSSPGWAKHAWSCLFAPWNAGATVVIANLGRFDAGALLDVLVQAQVTSLCAPPTAWRMLIQQDLAQWPVVLREVCAAGEPLNPEVIAAVEKAWNLTIRDGFGQTETTAQIANSPGQRVDPGAMGRPLPGYRIALIDADGNEADEGELAIDLQSRPAGLMVGYQQEGCVVSLEGRYYRTGDLAYRDADGWYTYVGRSDDVFKASDYRISPFELESILIEHPAVAEAAVVPAPDPVRLAVPKAYVALVAGLAGDEATARSIFAHIAARLAPYKRVRRLEFFDLPKTISGKIRRVELRRREQEFAARGARCPSEFCEDDFTDG
jgi:acetyl-CoA synthetase